MKQEMTNYTVEDHEIWGILFDRQLENLKGVVCDEYFDSLETLSETLNNKGVPDFRNVDKVLLDRTGWSIEVVAGLIEVEPFFTLLAAKRFCSSTWIRSSGETKHIYESEDVQVLPFDMQAIFDTPFNNDEIQWKYFELESMEQLYTEIAQLVESPEILITGKLVLAEA